jgi:soluble lytic murein transglycosylase
MYYSVIYDWRLHGTAAPVSSRLTPIGQVYSRVDPPKGRKELTCPAPSVATASSAPAPATSVQNAVH